MIKNIHYPQNYIVWDLETTGFKVGDGAVILEIGMFKVVNGEVLEKKRWVLDHGVKVPEHITAINGFTNEIVKAEGMDPKIALEEFLLYVREAEANLTHNGVRFDIGFFVDQIMKTLEWNIEKLMALKRHLENTSIDTAVLYKSHKAGFVRMWNESFIAYSKRVMDTIVRGKYNLGLCCDELGIDKSKITLHRALGDVEMTHEVFKAMLLK